MNQSSPGSSAYGEAGVDYEALDAGKRNALTEALATSGLLAQRGGRAIDQSRGEPAFVFEVGEQTFAFVVEGLGTKSIIARQLQDDLGAHVFRHVAYDTVAAIVNDLCCVGALPLVVNAYFATGSSGWYEDRDRQLALLSGWQQACIDAGAAWGGGESPSLPELVATDDIELAGSAVGLIPAGRAAILGAELAAGDEIVFVSSSGLHANGSSLARMIAGRLSDGYMTRLPSGRSFGEALLDPTVMYARLVAALLEDGVIHYLSHITGHGMLKLMRARARAPTESPSCPRFRRFSHSSSRGPRCRRPRHTRRSTWVAASRSIALAAAVIGLSASRRSWASPRTWRGPSKPGPGASSSARSASRSRAPTWISRRGNGRPADRRRERSAAGRAQGHDHLGLVSGVATGADDRTAGPASVRAGPAGACSVDHLHVPRSSSSIRARASKLASRERANVR